MNALLLNAKLVAGNDSIELSEKHYIRRRHVGFLVSEEAAPFPAFDGMVRYDTFPLGRIGPLRMTPSSI
jgi:hypothetical protein